MTCPRCGHAATLKGRFGWDGMNFALFAPDGLHWVRLRTELRFPARFEACTHCGHVWSECDAIELRALVDASAKEALLATLRRRAGHAPADSAAQGACPLCLDTVYVGGRVRAFHAERFFPEELRLFAWSRSLELDYPSGESPLRACAGCGHVWGALDAGRLRRLVEASGSDVLRKRMRHRGMPRP
jgi:hypothetical protein